MSTSESTDVHDAGLRVTVLGCRAGMPEPGWPSSGYLVHVPGGTVLLDCGPGVGAKAAAAAVRPGGLAAIFISHMHTDHCLDLLILGKTLAHESRDGDRIPLYVPSGAAATLRRFNALFPLGTDGATDHPADRVFDEVFDLIEYTPDEPVAIGSATVVPVAMRHVQPSCGFRVSSDGYSLAYTGDTTTTPAFDRLAGGVGLLLAEATLAEHDTTEHGHLSAGEAGQLAAECDVGALVMTHWSSVDRRWIEAQTVRAREHFSGRIDVAVPDHTLHVADPQET